MVKLYTRLSAHLFLAVGLLAGASANASLQKGVIEVGKVEGSAFAKDAQGRLANLTTGLTFKEGTRVETQASSTVELIFSNGATVLVSPETQIVVKIFTQVASPLIVAGKYRELQAEPSPSIVQIELFRGKIIGEARKLNPSTQFTVKSPVGLTRVRGTVWVDEYNFNEQTQTGTQVTVCVRGEVEVNDLAGSLPTPLIKGQEIEISGPAPKPTPKFLEDEEPITDDPSGSLPTPPTIKLGVADPDKIKGIVQEYKDCTVSTTPTPPTTPGETPPGQLPPGETPPGETPPGGDGDDTPVDPPKPPVVPGTPSPPVTPPSSTLDDIIREVIEKETQDNLSPSGG